MAGDATGKRLVVISASVTSGDVNTKFKNAAVPVVTCESAILDDLGMTKGAQGTDFGATSGQSKLVMAVASSDPMAAGLSGTQTVLGSGLTDSFSWGVPASAAVKVARLSTNSSRWAVFRYEKGALMMNSFKAPERRVALFLTDLTMGKLSPAGLKLTDAALRWAGRLPAKKPNGIDCGGATECASGLCVDGVCCNAACTGTCSSCNLPGSEGTCKVAPAGTDPRNQCAQDMPASCGRNGQCNGAGACALWPAGTLCRPQFCAGNNRISDTFCDGAGQCSVGGGGRVCDPYVCSPNGCPESCALQSDCLSGYYCGASTCTPKKAAGQTCASHVECSSGSCGGVCCATSAPCDCRKASPVNLLQAGGFDTSSSVTGFFYLGDPGTSIAWSNVDSGACPASGSLQIGINVASVTFSRCVPLVGGQTYNWGGSLRASIPSIDWSGSCYLKLYDGDACTGAERVLSVNLAPYATVAGHWNAFGASVGTNTTVRSGQFECFVIDDGANNPQLWFDRLYVSPAPGNQF
jgi:hypothetical protein